MADEITIPPVESLPSITEADEFSDVKLLPYGIRARGYDGQAIGPANYQAQALANRTHYLKTRLDSIGTPIKSVFGRTTQAITAQVGDYTADQITETAGKRFVTQADVQTWNAKLSASSVSTLNGKSLTAGGNVTLSDIGASPVAHQHAAAEITGLFPAIYSALVPGDGIAITSDSSGRSVIAATAASGGSGSGGQFTVVTRNITSVTPATFYLSDQTSFAFAAYALKEEAGSTATVTTDSYDSGDAYSHTPDLVFDGTVHPYTGEKTTLSADASFFSAPIKLTAKSLGIYARSNRSAVPTMTSNSQSGYIATASSNNADGGAASQIWKAFNKANSAITDAWLSAAAPSAGSPQWVAIQMPSAVRVAGYSIATRNQAGYSNSPKSWTFQGSTNGTTWVDLHSVVGDTQNTAGQVRAYTFKTTTDYAYYRLNITDYNVGSLAGFVAVGELDILLAEKILLRSGSTYYTSANGSLTTVSAPSTTADFDSTGFYWSGSIPIGTLTSLGSVSAVTGHAADTVTLCAPYTQIATPKQTSNIKAWNAITGAAATTTQTGAGSVRIAVSRNLTEWFTFSAGSWVSIGALTADASGASKLLSQGMTTATLNGITATQWGAFYSDTLTLPDTIAFAVALDVPNPETDAAAIDALSIGVSTSAWKLQTPAEVEIRWYRDRVIFKPTTTGNYKFAYQQPQQ
ncbi:MAG: discoidin domain-containing protein [Dickeya sp.]